MLLPGRLRDTTLGDVLGTLVRARATGHLTLIDDQGRSHKILVREGFVHDVETTFGPRLGELLDEAESFAHRAAQAEVRLGEYLLQAGQVTPEHLSAALRRLHLLKLDRLFQLKEASIRFHVARPRATDATPAPTLSAPEFLQGRPRKRRGGVRLRRAPTRSEALRVLGLEEGADPEEIKRAFRLLAQACHPDRFPESSAETRTRLIVQFSELSQAYHALVG